MKKFMTSAAIAALMAGTAAAEDVKLGIILGFTGPIESMVAHMAPGAEFAIKEANASGKFMGGSNIAVVTADSTCVDAAAATAAAERLITSDGVSGIVGADCSGVTGAILQNVARPNGMVMISPSATSPALSAAEDDGLFFRTAPSDARQGQVMSDILIEQGIKSVALTYVNTDYGKGLTEAFKAAYEAAGGQITVAVPHEDGKADYAAEVGTLAAAGGDRLVVLGYADEGGAGVLRAALDAGAFDTFHFADGMVSESLGTNFGTDLDGSTGQHPSPSVELADRFADLTKGAGFDASSPFVPESYDAAALIMLAMQAAGSTDPKVYKDKIFDVANAPGEKIQSGELAKGLEILAAGGQIDYVGASGVELIGPGEAAGNYREMKIEGGQQVTVQFR